MKKQIAKYFFSYVFILMFCCSYANTQTIIDSLENILKFATKNEKTEILNKLSFEYSSISFKKSFDYGNEALELAKKTGNKLEHGNALYNLGDAYYYQSNYNKALKYYQKSLLIFQETDNKEKIAILLNSIGLINFYLGKYDEAIKYFNKSLKINEEINNKQGIAMCLQNIAMVYVDWKNYEKALEYYKEALEINYELDKKSRIAALLQNIGIIYTKYDNYDKTIEYYQKSYEIFEKIDDKQGIACVLNNIGEVYKAWNKNEIALNYFQKSLALFEELGFKYGITANFYNIGEIYLGCRKYKLALEYFDKSLNTAKSIHLKEYIFDNYNIFSETYFAMGNYKKALEYYKKYTTLKDSVFSEETHKQIIEIQTKYETDKKKKEIEILNKEKELHKVKIARQNIIIYAVIAGLFLLSILALLIYNRYRYKQKANKLLTRQNNEIKSQRDKIAVQQKNITDSIQYASRIQNALLPEDVYIKEVIPEHFILNKPKDIVSGDFYWLKQIKNMLIITVADCTGHGVPGAFMSMLGVSFLNEIVKDKNIISASQALNRLNESVKKALHQTGKDDEARDGMDIALCVINKDTLELEFSGAYNPVYIVRNKELIQLKGDKRPIGIHLKRDIVFTDKQLQLQKGDLIYIFSDGYIDQFGGEKGTKFKATPFKKLLVNIYDKTMDEQKEILNNTIEEWKGNYEQIDDILIMGIKI
ncbi:MAG: tetratricopeptide repeat protein [Bacteroidales bacterium]|nr:tetratricopeptide repeat protein [Bacteroidales bacterium]